MTGPHLVLATTALSALRTIEEGRVRAAQSAFAAQAAERDATAAEERGTARAAEARRRSASILAARRARQAHGGADGTGTSLDLLGEIAGEGEFDALRAADPARLAAVNQLTRARSLRQRGAAARQAALRKAGATLLGGAR